MITPWNEIRPEKYLSPDTPVVPLSQTPCNQTYASFPPEVLLLPFSYELYANNGGAFLCLSCRMTCGVNKEKQNMSQTKIRYVKELTNDRYGTS